MEEHIIRNFAVADRQARGLADYYSRRTLAVRCPDPLPPEERADIEQRRLERLQCARIFVGALRNEMAAAG